MTRTCDKQLQGNSAVDRSRAPIEDVLGAWVWANLGTTDVDRYFRGRLSSRRFENVTGTEAVAAARGVTAKGTTVAPFGVPSRSWRLPGSSSHARARPPGGGAKSWSHPRRAICGRDIDTRWTRLGFERSRPAATPGAEFLQPFIRALGQCSEYIEGVV